MALPVVANSGKGMAAPGLACFHAPAAITISTHHTQEPTTSKVAPI